LIRDLVVSVLGGALTGWITNSIAVNMLFKKFFGRWGGVIESGYKELIQNLSSLVEQKLVNARALEKEIKKNAFNDTLRRWVKEILEKELPLKTENLRVKNIPGTEETLENIALYFERERPPELNGITLGQIISEESYRYIAEKNSSKIAGGAAEYKDTACQTLNVFLGERTFGNMFSEDFISRVKVNINEAVCETDFSTLNLRQDLETIAEISGIDDIIKKIEAAAGEARIGDLAPNPCGTARTALNHIADFMESGAGSALLQEAAFEFINAAENIDTKLSGILHPDLIEQLSLFIKRAAPGLVDGLILFIIDSRDEINKIIDEAARQHFKRNGRVNPLQALVFETVSKHSDFANKIIETLSQNRIEAGEKLSAAFNGYIKNTSAGHIVSVLKDLSLISAGTIARTIPKKLRDFRPENSEIFTALMAAKVKSIFKNPDFSFIKTKLLPYIFTALEEYLRGESGSGRLREKINAAIDSFASKNIRDTIYFTKINFNIKDEDVKNFIFRAWPEAAGINSGGLFTGISGMLPWKGITESVKNIRVNSVYGILQNEALYGKVADAVQNLVLRNLDTVLGGSVFEIAKNELDVLTPPQVNDMVHGFMGTQLKPINIMGAVLGGIAGFITALAASFFGLPSGFLWTMFAVYGLVFTFTGIFTNWIAIKMLFHPYKRIAGLNFPPFIGVAAMKQSEFAAGIAKTIQQNMLNEAALRRFYAGKKDALFALCRERLSAENYDFIDDYFSDDTRLAAAVDGICDYIKASHTKIAGYIDVYITERIESGGIDGIVENLPRALIQKIKSGGAAYIGKEIQRHIMDKDIPTSKIVDALLGLFYQYIRQNLQNIFGAKTSRRYEKSFVDYIENHTLNDMDGTFGFSKYISGKFDALRQKAEAAAAKLAAKRMTDGKRPLKNCFGGVLPALLKRNIGLINGLICKFAGSQKSVIVDKIMGASGGGSFFERIVKQAANAMMREDVEAITEIVIDEKLFTFLQTRREAVFAIIDGALDKPPGFDCKIFSEENTRTVLSRLFSQEPLSGALKNISAAYLKNLLGVKIKSPLSAVNMDTVDGFITRISPALNIAVSEIIRRLDDRTTVKRLNELFNTALSKVFGGQPVSRILSGTNLETEAANILKPLLNDASVTETAKIIMENILQKILICKDFYQHELFRRDLSVFLQTCVNENTRHITQAFLAAPLRGLARSISRRTKDAVIGDYILPAMFASCENQFPNIVNSLPLYYVVEHEINAMSPAEIESVFYGFAGPYFRKIILYGWIGLFAGLLSYAIGCFMPFLF
jgi:uncharacterized membrane protein YheB (UPF0754 family)